MDYIDWIISSFIFLITVSLILLTISSIIPINSNDDLLSKSLFISTVENIPVYNFYVNNTEEEIVPFSLALENLDGVSQNLFAIDGNNYFGVIQNNNQFFNYTNPNAYFWAEKETDTNFEIQLEENAGLNLDITEIENLKLWLDASSLELNDNDLVGSWTDLSGNNNHATQSNDTNKPTFKENILNGKPVIRFDGLGTYLTTPNLELTEDKYSIINILKNIKTGIISGTWSFSPYYNQGIYYTLTELTWRGNGYGANQTRFDYEHNTFFINSAIKYYGTTLQDYKIEIFNNTTKKTPTFVGTDPNTFNPTNNQNIRIGRWGNVYYFEGDVSEFFVFNKILTDTERLLIENYLSQKYAIDVENGLTFVDNKIEIVNLNSGNSLTTIEFINKDTAEPINCNYEYKNKKITILSCSSEAIIKSKIKIDAINKTSYELFQPYRIQVLKESFNDFDYSDNFTVVPDANINAGILVLENPSTITSNNSYYDYLGFLSTTNSLTAYVSYTDVNNNYFCRFSDSTITIGKTINSTQTILKTTSYSKTTDWHRVFFGYTKDNLINCNAGETKTYYQDENTIQKTQIVISTVYNNTLIDDFYIYLNNDLESNSSETIKGNYIDANITNNLATINLADNNFSSKLDFNFDKNLIVSDNNGISFITTESTEENKLVFFPQTKEFWMFKDADDNIEINLDENTGFDLDISEIENLVLWLDASSLELNDNDLVSSWTDLSDNNYHATQSEDGNKPTYKTNILNEKPTIRFNGEQYLQTTEFNNSLEQPNTAFVVFSAEPNTGYILFDGITDGNRFAFGSSSSETNTISIFAGTSLVSGESLPQDWAIWTGIYNTTDSKIIKNGLLKNTGNIGSQNLTGLTIGSRFNLIRFLIGDISEILLYNSALSDSNRLLVENYLSQKYALDLENGLSFTDNSIELINLNDNSKIIKIEFFNKETNKLVDCNYSYKNKKITIENCETNVVIKTRFKLNGVVNFPEYPFVSVTKTKEQMITKEKLDSLSNQDYYIRLSNKVKTLENIARIPAKKIYKNFSKLLLENGFIEEVEVEIKSFN
jgi:hypothetical protein